LARKFSWEEDYDRPISYADAQFAEALRTMNDREDSVGVDIGLEHELCERQPRKFRRPGRFVSLDQVDILLARIVHVEDSSIQLL
jgi:hypothetical protein